MIMAKYRTLFYHSRWNDKKWIDNAIALSTQAYNLWRMIDPVAWEIVKLGLSHEEIWVPDEGYFDYGPDAEEVAMSGVYDSGYLGTCYTSTLGQVRGGNNVGNGTCKRDASLVLKHPERWSYTEHDVPLWRFDAMMAYLNMEVRKNNGYGLGPNKNICSEVGHNANVAAGELRGPRRVVSPLTDALLMVRAGKEIKRLVPNPATTRLQRWQ